MSEENDLIDWQGGECPVDQDTVVDVMFSDRSVTTNRRAGELDWQRTNHPCDIIAYRVVEPPKPKVEIPEGFTPWAGGKCPVPPDTEVEVILRSGPGDLGVYAGDWDWRTSHSNGDIIAYRVVEPPKPKVKIPEGFTPWDGGERPIPGDTRFEMILRNGYMFTGLSSSCRWWHNNMHNDIIAYRVIEGEKPKAQTARDTQVGGEHYKKSTVQPWDVVDTWPIDQQIGFHRGNALKYVMRMGTKDENLREIRKAAHYLQKLVEVLEQKGGAQ